MSSRFRDSVSISSKAFAATLIAVFFLGKAAWKDSTRENGILFTALIFSGMSLFVAAIVFAARWFGIYRTAEEYAILKEQGKYSKRDESRRAVITFLFGLGSLIVLGFGISAFEYLMK
jgi:hypothetical protein